MLPRLIALLVEGLPHQFYYYRENSINKKQNKKTTTTLYIHIEQHKFKINFHFYKRGIKFM